MFEPFVPILIPPADNWTTNLDEQFVENRQGDGYSLDDLLLRCFHAVRNLSAALREALAFFEEPVAEGATIPDLLERLERCIPARSSSQRYTQRFAEHLADCRFAFVEFNRVVGIYAANRHLEWLAPLAELDDMLFAAAMDFEEGMSCEHESFNRERTLFFH